MNDASTRIIDAVAEQRGVAPSDLRVPLYEAVDTDALDTLLAGGGVSVTFEYDGMVVTATGSGEVEAKPKE